LERIIDIFIKKTYHMNIFAGERYVEKAKV